MSRLATTRSDIGMRPRLSILNTSTTLNTLAIASYCLQSLIGPVNLLSAISCYKFHISKDQQENMKFTIICHLAAFLFITSTDKKGGQMTNNYEFYVLLLIF